MLFICFNPCYAGSKIESHHQVRSPTFFQCFNPCYAGSKIESEPTYPAWKAGTCFNPCYAGSKIESIAICNANGGCNEFQSLLCWK